MRFTKALLKKPFDELTDEEFKCIGEHFSKHPMKPVPSKLVKCIWCKNLLWYDALGEHLWECLKNPCEDLATQEDRLLNNRKITHLRRCENFIRDYDLFYIPPYPSVK